MSKKKQSISSNCGGGIFRIPEQPLETKDFVSKQSTDLLKELESCRQEYKRKVGLVNGTEWHIDEGIANEIRSQIADAKKAIRLYEKRAARAKKGNSKASSVETNQSSDLVDVQQSEILGT